MAACADSIEVGGLHRQGLQPVGQAAGGTEHPVRREGAQFRKELGPAAGQALAQIGQPPLAGDAIEHQPAAGQQEGEALAEPLRSVGLSHGSNSG